MLSETQCNSLFYEILSSNIGSNPSFPYDHSSELANSQIHPELSKLEQK